MRKAKSRQDAIRCYVFHHLLNCKKGDTAENILRSLEDGLVPRTIKVKIADVYEALTFWSNQECIDVSNSSYKKAVKMMSMLIDSFKNNQVSKQRSKPIKYFISKRGKEIAKLLT
jgi:hypothetical protein